MNRWANCVHAGLSTHQPSIEGLIQATQLQHSSQLFRNSSSLSVWTGTSPTLVLLKKTQLTLPKRRRRRKTGSPTKVKPPSLQSCPGHTTLKVTQPSKPEITTKEPLNWPRTWQVVLKAPHNHKNH